MHLHRLGLDRAGDAAELDSAFASASVRVSRIRPKPPV
jgi:hypothetical protein